MTNDEDEQRGNTHCAGSPVVLPCLSGGKDADEAPPPLVLLPHPPHGFDLHW